MLIFINISNVLVLMRTRHNMGIILKSDTRQGGGGVGYVVVKPGKCCPWNEMYCPPPQYLPFDLILRGQNPASVWTTEANQDTEVSFSSPDSRSHPEVGQQRNKPKPSPFCQLFSTHLPDRGLTLPSSVPSQSHVG